MARFARRLACPTKIRHWIERFAIEHINSAAGATKKAGRILTEIQNELKSTLEKVINFVKRLAILATNPKNSEAEKVEEVGKAWSTLKMFLSLSEEKASANQLIKGRVESTTIDLRDVIMDFASAKDVTEVPKLSDKWCSSNNEETQSFWKVQLAEKLPSKDVNILKDLVYDQIILNVKQVPLFEHEIEREFAEDYIMVQKLRELEDVITTQYTNCRLVLYFSQEGAITSLR
jgi:hypothetical protein